jgi:hypothetical protein
VLLRANVETCTDYTYKKVEVESFCCKVATVTTTDASTSIPFVLETTANPAVSGSEVKDYFT